MTENYEDYKNEVADIVFEHFFKQKRITKYTGICVTLTQTMHEIESGDCCNSVDEHFNRAITTSEAAKKLIAGITFVMSDIASIM